MANKNIVYEQAKGLIRQEKIREGLEILDRLLEDPGHTEIFNDAGVCHYLLGDFEKGLEMLKRALDKSPEFALACINRFYLEKALDMKRNFDLSFRSINHDNISPDAPRPKISVIVRTFNRPEMLKHALQCLKDQTYKNFRDHCCE